MTDKSTLIAVVLSAGLVAGCGTAEDATPSTAATADAAPAASSAEASAYPETYRELGLPVLPGGVVTSAGRQSTSLRDGLSVHVSTERSAGETRTFYQQQMMTLGWTETTGGPGAALLPNMPVANVTFTKDQLTFRATITSAAPGSTVQITVVER